MWMNDRNAKAARQPYVGSWMAAFGRKRLLDRRSFLLILHGLLDAHTGMKYKRFC
jgi:hypothetical protein